METVLLTTALASDPSSFFSGGPLLALSVLPGRPQSEYRDVSVIRCHRQHAESLKEASGAPQSALGLAHDVVRGRGAQSEGAVRELRVVGQLVKLSENTGEDRNALWLDHSLKKRLQVTRYVHRRQSKQTHKELIAGHGRASRRC